MWEDSRGKTEGALRGVAHRDDAKDRQDESSRSDHGSSRSAGQSTVSAAGRFPKWAVPVVAAVSVLVIVGGTYAVTQGGSDDEPVSGSGPAAGDGPGAADDAEADGGSDDGAGGSVGGDPAALAGTVTGDVTGQFITDSGGDSFAGTLTFELDCSAGSTCTLSGFAPGGGLADYADNFFNSYLNLTWTGGPGTWSQAGTTPTSCTEIDPEDLRPQVTGTLTIEGDQVTIVSTRPQYEMGSATEADPFCSGSGTDLQVTGTLS